MAVSGRNSKWSHGTASAPAVLTDFTDKMRRVGISTTIDEVDATVFGDGYRSFEQSFKSGTFTAVYKYDAETLATLAALANAGTEVDFEYAPNGDAAGLPSVTGSMVMTGFNMDTGIGELLEISCTYRTNGAITYGTFA